MDQGGDVLHVGSSINIKRTDGRIHSAIVASINEKNVTVEWFEQGETKGKEVDLAVIYSLNSNIRSISNDTSCISPPQPTPMPVALQHDLSGSSEEEMSGAMAQSGRFSHKLSESDDEFNSNQFSPETATLSTPTRASLAYNGNNGLGRHAAANNGVGNDHHVRESNIPTTSRPNPRQTGVFLSNNGVSHHPVAAQNDANKESTVPTTSRASQQVAAKGVRSNVVKEVEKLKKNREERRQRQAEERAEKEAFSQLAPGNPHWELLNMIMDYRRSLDMKPLSESDAIEEHLITVCVRKRPLNKKEIQRKEVDVLTIPSKNQLIVHEPKSKVDLTKYLDNQLFRFDYAFDETCSNEIVYRYTAQPLIKTIFEGGFATCFAYGQTGSGKTHTMGGDFNGKVQDCQRGIYAMAAADVFKLAKSSHYRQLNLCISASFFEIYSGKVFDLLNSKAKLRILEDGKQQVQVVGLTEKLVNNSEEVLKLIRMGNLARTSGQTFANSNSSRSHAVFQIYLRTPGNAERIYGKFSLIDLAGNERGADTSSANRQTRIEGAEINKSLLALKECIRALGRKSSHLPFRVSKLTQVLRDSFVGANSRTCMIAMLSPGVSSCEHTLNTLRYADRVKELGGGDLITADSDQAQGSGGSTTTMDLHELKSLDQDNDMTPAMLNLHQAISELEHAEENMLDVHKQVTEQLFTASEHAVKLLRMADDVDYEQEAYCKNWKNMADNLIQLLVRSQDVVEDYLNKMSTEEQLSRSANM